MNTPDHSFNQLISIPIKKISLYGDLIIPHNSRSLAIFSHGSGKSRFSARNNFVAKELNKQGISTFLFDLLTREEDEHVENRFDIELLSERLIAATNYIKLIPAAAGLTTGYFGAGTGVSAALDASIELSDTIHAIVSRGGRHDLAINIADQVKTPTLLIIGEMDYEVMELNRQAYQMHQCEKKLEIIPGANHLFEKDGALQKVAALAAGWFQTHLESKVERSEMAAKKVALKKL
jgi:putative phosphoribosyl transferase